MRPRHQTILPTWLYGFAILSAGAASCVPLGTDSLDDAEPFTQDLDSEDAARAKNSNAAATDSSGRSADTDSESSGGARNSGAGSANAGTKPSEPGPSMHEPASGDDHVFELPDVYATRPSKGSAIAADEQGRTLAVANRATSDVTLFDIIGHDPSKLMERARVAVGAEPVSVTFSPDGDRLYVVNRADASVSVIAGALSPEPYVIKTIAVGAEPGLAALSPSGHTLYVSSWADGTLDIVDAGAMSVKSRLWLGGAPFAVCVTNDGDEQDDDEQIFVTDFYSRPIQGKSEATDGSRQGRIFRVAANAPDKVAGTTYLDPILVKGIEEAIDAAKTQAFPNQLHACTIHGDELYVTATGASPAAFERTTDFRQNVHGLLYAIKLDDPGYHVDVSRSVNLSELVAALQGEKRFAAVPNDVAFVDGTDFGYISVQSADMVLRVDLSGEHPIAGSPSGANFLATDKSPQGLTIVGTTAFTYNEVGRSVSIIDLASQTTAEAAVPSAPLPAAGSHEADVLLGQRFFNTGLARWSTAAWVSCSSCHPGGMTDNVTWVFPAGPRQTVDTSATFNRDGSIQRVLNWTAIFDEIHDFELNTRGVAGGVGAIVTDPALDVANRIDFVGPGGVADPENGFNVGSVRGVQDDLGVLDDWDKIELFMKTLRTPRGATYVAGDPEAGRKVFEHARCQNCHGGPLWTLSELYYTPVLDGDLRELTFAEAGITSVGAVRADQTVLDDLGFDATSIINNDANGAPQRHLCSVRIVGTFAAVGPDGRGAAEIRQNDAAAQGVDGFNVPSLLGINMGAPYLHNGAAESLEELFNPAGEFAAHLQAGNQVFVPSEQEVADLVAFLKTIDEDTPTYHVPADQQFCPVGVVPPVPQAEDPTPPAEDPGYETPAYP